MPRQDCVKKEHCVYNASCTNCYMLCGRQAVRHGDGQVHATRQAAPRIAHPVLTITRQ
jgi:hypothetical protein